MNLKQIMNILEVAAGKNTNSVKGPTIPAFDWVWDFLVGTTSDLNMDRLVAFYENNLDLQSSHNANPWAVNHSISMS